LASEGTTVALDGFGVERGFSVLASGAGMAAADGISLRVFGPVSELGDLAGDGIEVIDTGDSISNDDDPVGTVRARPDASVVRAVADAAAGNSDAVVSMGPTGATMAAATFGLGRARGVKRPALAAQVPLPGRTVLFLDVGANLEVRTQHLVQFAFLGSAFMQAVRGVQSPEVGLLSVGEEPGKGTPELVEANEILESAPGINFVGNIEGGDVPLAGADVVVTDGFTGNAVLKAMEGTVKAVTSAIGDAARSNPVAGAGGLLLKPALGGLKRDLHPDTTGGAILLGLATTAVVGHGNAGPEGVANAIRLAARSAEVDAPERTGDILRLAGVNRGAIRAAGVSAGES
jgi:glycerol-3-phosphate acyltransferase PlsX